MREEEELADARLRGQIDHEVALGRACKSLRPRRVYRGHTETHEVMSNRLHTPSVCCLGDAARWGQDQLVIIFVDLAEELEEAAVAGHDEHLEARGCAARGMRGSGKYRDYVSLVKFILLLTIWAIVRRQLLRLKIHWWHN